MAILQTIYHILSASSFNYLLSHKFDHVISESKII